MLPFAVISWLLLTLIVTGIGHYRKIGYIGAGLISLFFSPLIGFLVVLSSKRVSDEEREQTFQANMEYQNFLIIRKYNPQAFSVQRTVEGQEYVKLENSQVPNSELGKPIFIRAYHERTGKELRKGKEVMQLEIGNKMMDVVMPKPGKLIRIHDIGCYLKPGDELFIIEEI
jgi:hypothetical protein